MAENGLVARCHASAVLPGLVPDLHELAGRQGRREQAVITLEQSLGSSGLKRAFGHVS